MTDKIKTLNIIGCGQVGKTLGRLWAKHNIFRIRNVVTQSIESAQTAVEIIGCGQPVRRIKDMQKADIYLIATPDDQILNSCQILSALELLEPENIVFHCSGAKSSKELDLLKQFRVHGASVHPVKSFANVHSAYETFTGTFCGIEGDVVAIKILRHAFEEIGGIIFSIDPEHKTEYHAANVIVCNYLTALIELGTHVYERSGLSHETAMQVMEPLVRETVNNNFTMGTVNALTGPIARGDSEIVSRQLETLNNWNAEVGDFYRKLGKLALANPVKGCYI